jgi:hypothetical protein
MSAQAAPQPAPRRVTRWVCPGGVRITLAYRSHTTGHRDGWYLSTHHPASRVVLATIRLHLDHPQAAGRAAAERELAAALDAVGAVPVIGPWPALGGG